MAALAAVSAAVWAAKGVDLREPRKPISPEEAQDRALPLHIGDGDHGVVEGGADMHLALLNVLALTTALADYLLAL